MPDSGTVWPVWGMVFTSFLSLRASSDPGTRFGLAVLSVTAGQKGGPDMRKEKTGVRTRLQTRHYWM